MARAAKKAEFVRRHLDKTPADIIAAGASKGMSLSRSYIAKLQSERPRATVKSIGRVQLLPQGHEPTRAEFSKLVWRVGTLRAREWMRELEPSLSTEDQHE